MKVEGEITNIFEGKKGWKGLQLDGNLVYGGFSLPNYGKGELVLIEYEQQVVQGKTYRNIKSIEHIQQRHDGRAQTITYQPPQQEREAPAQQRRPAVPELGNDIRVIVTRELDLMSEILSQAADYRRFKDLPPEVLQKYLVTIYLQAHKEVFFNGSGAKWAR